MTKARDIASAAPAPSTVSATEIGYLDGVTSAIQTQIDSKIGSASAISPTLIDAKGDLIVGSAADTAARLAVGTNNHVLTADSSATNGVKWAAAGGGGLVFISRTSFSATTLVNVDNVFTSTYDNYRIVYRGYNSSTGPSPVSSQLRASGTATTTNYTHQQLYADGTTVGARRDYLGTDEFHFGDNGGPSYEGSLTVIDISGPNLAAPTSYISSNSSRTPSQFLSQFTGSQSGTTQFDGLSFSTYYNATGTIDIYGYAKA